MKYPGAMARYRPPRPPRRQCCRPVPDAAPLVRATGAATAPPRTASPGRPFLRPVRRRHTRPRSADAGHLQSPAPPPQTAAAPRVAESGGMRHLDGHMSLQLLVPGEVNGGERAGPEHFPDAVTTDQAARQEPRRNVTHQCLIKRPSHHVRQLGKSPQVVLQRRRVVETAAIIQVEQQQFIQQCRLSGRDGPGADRSRSPGVAQTTRRLQTPGKSDQSSSYRRWISESSRRKRLIPTAPQPTHPATNAAGARSWPAND